MSEFASRIVEVVGKLQKELRCGICCSTFKDPVHATCHHSFCRSCLDSCFQRKRKVQCPICRTILDKRSCRDTFQITHAVQNYLKLAEAFKQDIENMKTFRTLPPEKAFLESQMPLDVTIIPENDGKRCAPEFAIPLLPARRKRASKPAEPSTSDPPTEFSVFAVPKSPPKKKSVLEKPERTESKATPPKKIDSGTTTDPLKVQLAELQALDIQEYIDAFQQCGEDDEIDALFKVMPTLRTFIRKNVNQIINKLCVTIPATEKRKSDKRVSFASSQELEQHRYPDPVESVETVLDEPVVIRPKPKSAEGEQDEVVEDSEGEDDGDTQDIAEITQVGFKSLELTKSLEFFSSRKATTPRRRFKARRIEWTRSSPGCRRRSSAPESITIGTKYNLIKTTFRRSCNSAKIASLHPSDRSKMYHRWTRHLIELVQLCGGEILSSYENQKPENLYIIFSKNSEAIGEARNMKALYNCQVLTMEWVLDSISEYSRLPTETYQAVD
ncbi:Protein CBR-BRC-1, partial [Caenorhabditis briggsae]